MCVCVCVCVHVCVHSVTQWCWSLCHAMDNSPPGSSVYWMSQARILEWIAISSSRGSSWPRDQTCISCVYSTGKWILHHCATREAQSMPSSNIWKTQLPFPWGIRKMSSNLKSKEKRKRLIFLGLRRKWIKSLTQGLLCSRRPQGPSPRDEGAERLLERVLEARVGKWTQRASALQRNSLREREKERERKTWGQELWWSKDVLFNIM